MLILGSLFVFAANEPAPSQPAKTETVAKEPPAPAPVRTEEQIDEDVLWVARALYTETEANRTREMFYIAWVIRNRIEAQFWGAKSAKEVILEPFQFSAFNSPKMRSHYSAIGTYREPRDPKRWEAAKRVARHVLRAPAFARPIPADAFHFYAEVGMKNRDRPPWAVGRTPESIHGVEPDRLRIYAGIS
jgi:spore germination cell wall hydrolase CwlJ-like protein